MNKSLCMREKKKRTNSSDSLIPEWNFTPRNFAAERQVGNMLETRERTEEFVKGACTRGFWVYLRTRGEAARNMQQMAQQMSRGLEIYR